MSGRYLLDTNIVIALFADEPAVTDRLRDAEEVFIKSSSFTQVCQRQKLWHNERKKKGEKP